MELKQIFDGFPILESNEYILKNIEVSNLEELFQIYSNDQVFKFCGILPKNNKETVKNMINHFERDFQKQTRVKWGIFSINDINKLLGIIEVFDINKKVKMVTIGYYLAEDSWGKGIATNAVKILIEFLFNNVKVNRIQAEVMPLNETSKRVLLKNGFHHEGTIRAGAVWAGKGIVDLEIYGILKKDFINLSENGKSILLVKR